MDNKILYGGARSCGKHSFYKRMEKVCLKCGSKELRVSMCKDLDLNEAYTQGQKDMRKKAAKAIDEIAVRLINNTTISMTERREIIEVGEAIRNLPIEGEG